MDLGNYINMPVQSLQAMCANRLVAHVVEIHKNSKRKRKTYVREAIDSLQVPTIVKEMLNDLVEPMHIQYSNWHKPFNFSYSPIWTPYGTVDVVRSISKLIEDETMPPRRRLLMAMLYCQKEHVFELKDSLNKMNRRAYRKCGTKIPQVWMDIIDAYRRQVVPDQHVLQKLYAKGIMSSKFLLLRCHHEVSFRYFVEKASPETLTRLLEQRSFKQEVRNSSFSPSTYALFFSKLNAVHQERWKSLFASMVLMSLMHWPYQFLFEDAALSLAGNLNPGDFVSLLDHAVQGARPNDKQSENLVDIILQAGDAERNQDRRHEFVLGLNNLIQSYESHGFDAFCCSMDNGPFKAAEKYFRKVILDTNKASMEKQETLK